MEFVKGGVLYTDNPHIRGRKDGKLISHAMKYTKGAKVAEAVIPGPDLPADRRKWTGRPIDEVIFHTGDATQNCDAFLETVDDLNSWLAEKCKGGTRIKIVSAGFKNHERIFKLVQWNVEKQAWLDCNITPSLQRTPDCTAVHTAIPAILIESFCDWNKISYPVMYWKLFTWQTTQ